MELTINEHSHPISYLDLTNRFYPSINDSRFNIAFNPPNNPNFEFSNNINPSKEITPIMNEISDLIKCYICLDKIKNPKMCKFCHRLTCDECIRKWLNEKNTCGYCRHRITRFDFINVPFMSNIKILLDYNKNLEEKKRIFRKRK